jgi:hypothetical protein
MIKIMLMSGNLGGHIILTHGRSGSNYLTNTLNNHPDIVNFGEVLGKWTLPNKLYRLVSYFGVSESSFLHYLYTGKSAFYLSQAISALSHLVNKKKINWKSYSNIETVGIKDFVFLVHERKITQYIQSQKNLKVIYLYRENLLRRYLSGINMKTTQVVKIESSNQRAYNKYQIDIEHMLDELKVIEHEHAIGDEILSSLDKSRVFIIKFESFFQIQQYREKIMKELYNFLNVSEVVSLSNQRKIMSDNLGDIIENFNEVQMALEGTRFETFLDS